MKRLIATLLLLICLSSLVWSMQLTIPFEVPTDGFDSSALAKLGYGSTVSPGSLQLPVKSINVLLPPGAKVLDYAITLIAPKQVIGSAPQRNNAFSDTEKQLSRADDDHQLPASVYLGMRKWGDLCYAAFNVLPATWDGGLWQWSTSCTIDISYSQDRATGRIPSSFSDNSFFVNPGKVSKWYTRDTQRNYDILVIGTPELYAAMSSWVSFRFSQGLQVSFTEISTALSQGTGTSNAEKLRSYIQSQYSSNNFRYLLLLGDYNIIPVAYLTPEPDGWDQVPSDFFYGDLSSNWDSDNDGRLGEYSGGNLNQDYEVDFTPEVFVGRLSTNSPAQLQSIAGRIVAYEQTSAAWKGKNLLPAAYLNYNNEPEAGLSATDGADFMEFVRDTALAGQENFSMYEQLGVVPSYPGDLALSEENFRDILNTQNWGMINWSAHGSGTSSARKIWMDDINEDNFPDQDEMTWLGLVDRSSFDNLDTTTGTVIFAASCYNGLIDADEPCLAEYALQKRAVGVLAATRTGWYKVGWRNPGWGGLSSYNYHFLENFRQAGLDLGASHAYTNLLHTRYYLFGDPLDSGGIIWPELQNVYAYLLFGDPLIGYNPVQNIPQGEVLVWEPTGQQGITVVNALRENLDMNVIYTDKLIPDYDYIHNFAAVFCLLGFGEETYELEPNSLEHGLLNSYLEEGGNLYLERGTIPNTTISPFWAKLGVSSLPNAVTPIQSIRHLGSNMTWQYDTGMNLYQALNPEAVFAQPLFATNNMDPIDAYISIWNSNGLYRSIASSFSLARVLEGENNLTDMLSIVCDTLGISTDNPSSLQDETNIMPARSVINYPNPAKDKVQFSFSNTEGLPLQVDIFNLKGQKVRSLFLPASYSEASSLLWDCRDATGRVCADGIYLFRAKLGNASFTGKQILIK